MTDIAKRIECTIRNIGIRADDQSITLFEISPQDGTQPNGKRAQWLFESISETRLDRVLDGLSGDQLFRWTSTPEGDYDDAQEFRLFRLASGVEAILVETGICDRIVTGNLAYYAWENPRQAVEGIAEVRSSTCRRALSLTLGSISRHLDSGVLDDPDAVKQLLEWVVERTSGIQPGTRVIDTLKAVLRERDERRQAKAL